MDKIRIGDLQFDKEERDALQRVIDSARVSEGREVQAFEEQFADWVGVKHCVAVSSGTAALMVGLKSLEYLGYIPSDATVLIPALTFIATANAVKMCEYEPIFGDVGTDTYTLESYYAMVHKTDVTLPVHLFGFSADMANIASKARWSNDDAIVCEDACQAHGTMIGDRKAGSIGLWGAFSFYIAHTVQAGELGALVTNDADIALMARRLKAQGRTCACKICTRNTTGCHLLENGDPRFRALYPGYNFKAMEWSAAIARVQLDKVDANIERRKGNRDRLTRSLFGAQDKLKLPRHGLYDVPMVYPLVLKSGNRDALIVKLESAGVEARPMFGCIPTQQPAYREYKERYAGMLPISERFGRQGFYVGCHQYLNSDHMKRIAEVILESVEQCQISIT